MNRSKTMGYQPLPNRSQDRPGSLLKDTMARRPAGPIQSVPNARTAARAGTSAKPIAPGQPAPPGRSRDRFVSLPEELEGALEATPPPPTVYEDLEAEAEPPLRRGRLSTYCVAEALDRPALEAALQARGEGYLLHTFPDALHGCYEGVKGDATSRGDVFYFDYGVVVFWGLTQRAEAEVLARVVAPALVDALPPREVELDECAFQTTRTEKPHIQNDCFTIGHRAAGDYLLKLSISHALAQSTKLSVYEARVVAIVESTKDLPERLASTGRVGLSRKNIAQLMGRVFLQKSAVNLLSTVLDTPEFFWSAPDALQSLYKRVCDYVEYDTRVEVLNSRFQVLQEMLDMLRDHQNNFHGVRLEWIIIWLIVVEVVVGLFECASILGWVGKAGG